MNKKINDEIVITKEFDQLINTINSLNVELKNQLIDWSHLDDPYSNPPYINIQVFYHLNCTLFKNELKRNIFYFKDNELLRNHYDSFVNDLKNEEHIKSLESEYGKEHWNYKDDDDYYSRLEYDKRFSKTKKDDEDGRPPQYDLFVEKIKGYVFLYYEIVDEIEQIVKECFKNANNHSFNAKQKVKYNKPRTCESYFLKEEYYKQFLRLIKSNNLLEKDGVFKGKFSDVKDEIHTIIKVLNDKKYLTETPNSNNYLFAIALGIKLDRNDKTIRKTDWTVKKEREEYYSKIIPDLLK